MGKIALGFFTYLFLFTDAATAQLGQFEDELRYSATELPQDRNLTRGIRKAEEGLARGEYTQALRFLDNLLAAKEDYFLVPGLATKGEDFQQIVGLKEKARQLLGQLSSEGRSAYLGAYAPAAQRELEAAIRMGDRQSLVDIIQRYFHTPAGYQASMLLAQRDADSGRINLAAMTYEHLLGTPAAVEQLGATLAFKAAVTFLAAGDDQRATEVLQGVTTSGSLELGGNTTKLTQRRSTIPWIEQNLGSPRVAQSQDPTDWLTTRGSPSRDANSQGGFPHMRVRWEARLLAQPRLEQIYEDFASERLRRGELTPLASTPLAIGDTVLIRSAHSLVAVDFETGKRIWQAEPQPVDELEQLAKEGTTSGNDLGTHESARFFGQRLWKDQLYSSLSSDGRRVFVIRNLTSFEELDDDPFGPALRARGSAGQAITNRLCAYDLATQGKLLWEFDGAIPQGELAGAFFVGTPLAIGETIYGLVEMKNAVWLYAADAGTGKLTWKQQLVNLDRGILFDAQRRWQNATPSYRNGMLICPIGSGSVIGVDLVKQSLSWAYRYEISDNSDPRYGISQKPSKNEFSGPWTDAAVVIAEDRLLLTPPESTHLHCLDLHSGKLLWKQPQKEMMKLACVDSQTALLIGPNAVRGIRLQDGKSAWPEIKLAKGVSPSGSGFLSDGRYYLPLSSAEVVAIDLSMGEIVANVKSRDGRVLGNLTCHRDAVLANDGKSLQKYDQIEVLRREADQLLADSPQNVEALRTLGEIAYNQGRLSEAVSLLERAYQGDRDSDSTREILAEALLSALDEDYAAYDSRLPFLEKLQDNSPLPRAELLRIKANGLAEVGKYLSAVDACLAVYELELPLEETFQLKLGREVAVSNWVNGQLAAIRSKAAPETQKQIDQKLSDYYSDTPLEDFARADRFVAYFRSLLDESSRVKLARRASKQGNLLTTQLHWQELLRSQDAKVQGEATARLASLLHREGLGTLAREYDQRLAGPFAEKTILEAKTGKQVSEAFSLEQLPEVAWPTGKIEASTFARSQASASSRSPTYGIRMERTDEVLGGCRIFLSRVGELTVHDSLGREFFQSTVQSQQRRRVHYRQAGNMHAVSYGNVLVVSFGRQLAAFNTLATSANSQPTILWQTSLTSELDGDPYGAQPGASAGQRPGSYRSNRTSWDGRWIGVLGPVNERGCVFQVQHRLVCVDLLDGSLRWSRDDVPFGCDLFGDEKFVFATPQGGREARVFSMIDGREVAKSKIPPWREHLTTRGRNIIRWRQDANEPPTSRWELAAIDSLTGETLWSQRYPEDTRVDVDRGRYLACVTPQGTAQIIDAADGSVLVESQLGKVEGLKEIHLTVGTRSFLLLTNSTYNQPGRTHARAINPSDYAIITGKVVAFDRQSGAPLWARPAELTQQGWPVTHPCDLPTLVFAANHYRHVNSSSTRQGISLLALDRRTGASVYRTSDLPTSGGGHFQVSITDANQPRLSAEMSNKVVQFTFTDKPRPPLPPAMSEVESDNLPSKGGLSNILRKQLNSR